MSDYKTMLAEKLMNEYGISKQQAQSKTVDAFAEMLKDTSDFYQAYKESGIDTVVNDMNEKLKNMNDLYKSLIDKFQSIEMKLRRMDDISTKLEKLLDDTKDFKNGIEELSGRPKDAVVMYKEILKATKSVFPDTYGFEKDAIKASSYISFATMSGNESDNFILKDDDSKSESGTETVKKRTAQPVSFEKMMKGKKK